MNKTLEQLIKDISKEIAQENHIGTNLVTGHKAAYFKEMTLRVAKQVREATIKECIDLSQIKYYNGETGYLDSKVINDLDKESIEIDE